MYEYYSFFDPIFNLIKKSTRSISDGSAFVFTVGISIRSAPISASVKKMLKLEQSQHFLNQSSHKRDEPYIFKTIQTET